MIGISLNALAKEIGMNPDAQGRYNWDQEHAQEAAKKNKR